MQTLITRVVVVQVQVQVQAFLTKLRHSAFVLPVPFARRAAIT